VVRVKQFFKSSLILSLFAFIAGLLFLPYIFEKLSFVTFGSLAGLSPLKYQIARAFRSGEYPLWNPYNMCGMPFHSAIGILDPLLVPQLFLKGSLGFLSSHYLAFLCAGLFMYIYLRKSHNLPPLASFLGGALYMSSPFFAAASPELPFMAPPSYLPLAMLFSDIALAKRSYFYSALTGAALALTFLSGNLESYYYIALIFFVLQYGKLVCERSELSGIGRLAEARFLVVGVISSALFMAVDLFPTLEVMRSSGRTENLMLLESAIFIILTGVAACGAALLAIRVSALRRRVLISSTAIILALLFIVDFDKSTFHLGLKGNIFYPDLRLIMTHGMTAFDLMKKCTTLPVALISQIAPQRSTFHFQDPAYLFNLATLALFLSALWLKKAPAVKFYLFFAAFIALPAYTFFPNLFHSLLRMNEIQFPRLIFAFFFFACVVISYAFVLIMRSKPLAAAFVTALIIESVLSWNLYTFQKDDIRVVDAKHPEILFMSKLGGDYRMGIKDDRGRDIDNFYENRYKLTLGWNMPLFWNAKTVEKSSINLTRPRFDALWKLEEENKGVTPTILAGTKTSIYNMMGMKYLFAREPFAHKNYKLTLRGDSYNIYENLKALPRLYAVSQVAQATAAEIKEKIKAVDFNPVAMTYVELAKGEDGSRLPAPNAVAPQIEWSTIKEGYNYVTFKVRAHQPAFLATTDAYDRNWKAYIDGAREKVYLCNYYFRGICVPPGEHIVEFKYRPLSFSIGLIVTLSSLILTLLIFLVDRRVNRHCERSEAISGRAYGTPSKILNL